MSWDERHRRPGNTSSPDSPPAGPAYHGVVRRRAINGLVTEGTPPHPGPRRADEAQPTLPSLSFDRPPPTVDATIGPTRPVPDLSPVPHRDPGPRITGGSSKRPIVAATCPRLRRPRPIRTARPHRIVAPRGGIGAAVRHLTMVISTAMMARSRFLGASPVPMLGSPLGVAPGTVAASFESVVASVYGAPEFSFRVVARSSGAELESPAGAASIWAVGRFGATRLDPADAVVGSRRRATLVRNAREHGVAPSS